MLVMGLALRYVLVAMLLLIVVVIAVVVVIELRQLTFIMVQKRRCRC